MHQYKVEDLISWEIDGMDGEDYPDFCDAYISKAVAKNGHELDDDELTWLNENDYEGVNQAVQSQENIADWLSSQVDDAMREAEREEFLYQAEKTTPWVGL